MLCATGIVGMIITSIADEVGAAITFGFIGATGAFALLLVGVLVPAVESAASWDEERAAAVEDAVPRLVAAGAAEEDLRAPLAAALLLCCGACLWLCATGPGVGQGYLRWAKVTIGTWNSGSKPAAASPRLGALGTPAPRPRAPSSYGRVLKNAVGL